jgi:BolA protein
MSVRDDIEKKLSLKFTPSHLEVLDDSEKHRGHAGSRPGGETHFRVRISSSQLDGLTRVAQHRAVMETLDTELRSGVHALAIEVVRSDPAAG